MIRKLAVILAAVAAMAAIAAGSAAGAQGATARPIVLLVTRHHAIQLMQHHWWCTRDQPGVFECTPGQPL